MSWQAYVDTNLVGSGHIDKAAIFSAAGDSVWAASTGFNVSPKEVQHILACFSQNDKAFAEGLHIGEVKYVAVRADNKMLVAKKGKEGIAIAKSKLSLIIAHHPDTVESRSASNTVEVLTDYLISVQY